MAEAEKRHCLREAALRGGCRVLKEAGVGRCWNIKGESCDGGAGVRERR